MTQTILNRIVKDQIYQNSSRNGMLNEEYWVTSKYTTNDVTMPPEQVYGIIGDLCNELQAHAMSL